MSDQKIRTAVIGVGYLGRWHAEKLAKNPESELVGVVDLDEKTGPLGGRVNGGLRLIPITAS